jgi:trans-aconitate 2-methyltransferase
MNVFEFDGEKYKLSSSHQEEWGNQIIATMAFKDTAHVLDLGCGDGRLTQRIAELVSSGKVLGIDSSKGMIDSAKIHEMNNLAFELQDINKLNYCNTFDVIFSNAALHWVKDHKNLLESCYKALTTDGYIRFNFAANGNCSNFFNTVSQVMTKPEFKPYLETFEWPWYMPDSAEYTSLVHSLSFREIKVWEENADRHFANKDTLIGWINQPSIVPFLHGLPAEIQEEFRTAVIDKMVETTGCSNGTFFETFRRINVYAVKAG